MTASQEKRKRNIHHKYRVSIINEDTLDEVRRAHLSVFNVLLFVIITFIISGTIVATLIVFTPLKEIIPGYPDPEIQVELISNAERVDSLMTIVKQEQIYWDGVRNVLLGEISNEVLIDTSATKNKEIIMEQLRLQASQQELEFRNQIEQEEQYSLGLLDKASEKITQSIFLSPVKGVITDHFDKEKNHYGVDIAVDSKEHIVAMDNGTVIFVGYTLETGNTISIQHRSNLVSTYRHASLLYKKPGDKVKVGEVIGVAGSTGTLSNGDHLYFELWRDGEPIDPETIIVF